MDRVSFVGAEPRGKHVRIEGRRGGWGGGVVGLMSAKRKPSLTPP